MVGNNLVNNEQIAMAYVYKNNPELFLPFENHANMHKDYEFNIWRNQKYWNLPG